MASESRPIDVSTLPARYGGVEGEHPQYPRAQWRFDRAFSVHRLPYWDWVAREIAGTPVMDDGLAAPMAPAPITLLTTG